MQIDIYQVLAGAGISWAATLWWAVRKYGDYRTRSYAAEQHFLRIQAEQKELHSLMSGLVGEVHDVNERLIRVEVTVNGRQQNN